MKKLQKKQTLSIIALILLLTLSIFMTNAISIEASTIYINDVSGWSKPVGT